MELLIFFVLRHCFIAMTTTDIHRRSSIQDETFYCNLESQLSAAGRQGKREIEANQATFVKAFIFLD